MWSRVAGGELRTRFDEDFVAAEIATCPMVTLELLHSARNPEEFKILRTHGHQVAVTRLLIRTRPEGFARREREQ